MEAIKNKTLQKQRTLIQRGKTMKTFHYITLAVLIVFGTALNARAEVANLYTD
jgi:hypothetical protein